MERFIRSLLLLILLVAAIAIIRVAFATATYLERERIVYVPTSYASCPEWKAFLTLTEKIEPHYTLP